MRHSALILLALTCPLAALAQTEAVYNDASKPMAVMWADQGTLSEKVVLGAPEGTKAMVFAYSLPAHWADLATYPQEWGASKTFTGARRYAYFSFACRITADNTSADTLSFWCIHCDESKKKDLDFKGKFGFHPTSSWQVFSVPLSLFAADPLDLISSIKFNFGGASGSGEFQFDDLKFGNAASGIVLRPARPVPGRTGYFAAGNSTLAPKPTWNLLGAMMPAERNVPGAGRIRSVTHAINGEVDQ
jgi:hypothetical protein